MHMRRIERERINAVQKTDVLIVGAGPVGLTLAMTLRQRGVDVLLIERRARDEAADARCNTVASRTMEIWRRLGVADKVRAVGMPDNYPGDIVYATKLHGHEIARVPMTSRRTRFVDWAISDGGWPTPEPVHRASQFLFDPVLREHAEHVIGVPMRYETELLSFDQDADGVTAQVGSRDGGESQIKAKFMVGCDGGRSMVRRELGIDFVGDEELHRNKSRLVRAPWMRDHIKGRPFWSVQCIGPGPNVSMVAINGTDLWLIHVPYVGAENDDKIDFDARVREALCLKPDQNYEVVKVQDWIARRFVAERFRKDRVFICGDAAHIWVPMAGYGMNCGVADADNLANCLSAYLQGWAGEAILDCHEIERHPVTDQVSRFAMGKSKEFISDVLQNSLSDLDKDGAIGREARRRFGQHLLGTVTSRFACPGLNYGYFYDNSPLIAYDGTPPPAYDLTTYTPSTVPGCRMPHFWRPDGVSLYDLIENDGYTLVRFDPETPIEKLTEAAAQHQMPLSVLDIWNPDPFLYGEKLVLVRSDRHVAWRGDQLPDDVADLVDRLRGKKVAPLQTTDAGLNAAHAGA